MDSDDSMNPYRPSSGFFNLLQSQLETQNLEYTPYESPCSDAPSEPTSPQKNHKSRHEWLPTDKVMLVSVWLNTSKDPVTSNEKRRRPKREASHCKKRWGRINDLVCKFVGCYEAATREKSSGQNEDDVMKLAHRIYFNDHKQRGRVGEDGSAQDAQPVIDVEDEPMSRPPGVKVAKGKAKKSSKTKPDVEDNVKAFLEFQMERVTRMYEMKQKDFALKEKEFALKKEYIKHVILENLIAKNDSLTETEKALKDKLINDMMSSG
ncbi:PREDICTED: glutathione S-transferase T3-like [Camelina sativa]|uniref:Glutathione S-transferase T3-like n=1 Tax=Camelina sativa TaxID=90675 RepID=A0ABM1Q776_CAMSA|nr:PREDICTED: glutathione S-transferase T3-like [Camelina sativa]